MNTYILIGGFLILWLITGLILSRLASDFYFKWKFEIIGGSSFLLALVFMKPFV